jgi:hypothetical protein
MSQKLKIGRRLKTWYMIRLKHIYNMLHACFTPIALYFVYTSWKFYAFSGTNLLTRCHSASSLFSAIFVFQQSYTGNILGIGRNEARSSYFPPTRDGVQRRVRGVPGGGHTIGWRAPWPAPPHGVGPSGALWHRPSAYIKPPTWKP